jgi:glutamate dehydrogenase
MMESLSQTQNLGMSLYRPPEAESGTLRFKVLQAGSALPLPGQSSDARGHGVLVLDERPYKIEPEGATTVRIDDFGMKYRRHAGLEIDGVREVFQDAFTRVAHGEIENDDFNRLVLRAGLTIHFYCTGTVLPEGSARAISRTNKYGGIR